MKKLLLLGLAALLGAGATRGDVRSRLPYRGMHTASRTLSSDSPAYIPVIVDGELPDSLGAIEWHRRGNLALACIPAGKIAGLQADRGGTDALRGLHLSLSLEPALDVSRRVTGVDAVHAGTGLPRSYRGTGVLTGICDTGFDPRHPAFGNLVSWSLYDGYNGTVSRYSDPADMPLTDDASLSHATHVANILAGDAPGGYHGGAPGAALAVTTSPLTDAEILAGMEDIVALARQRGERAVINVSAGSYLGPHDGTDLPGQYLERLVRDEDAVICLSAGNYGHRPNALHLDVDTAGACPGTMFCDTRAWSGFEVNGACDVWSSDSTAFLTQVVVYDFDTKGFVWASEWMGPGSGQAVLSLPPDLDDGSWHVWMSWGRDRYNGRYTMAVDYDIDTPTVRRDGPWARYFTGIRLAPADGRKARVDIYADGITSFLHNPGVPGMSAGTPDGSVSNVACAPSVVAVGAWNSRNTTPVHGGGEQTFNFDTDNVAYWSAWGTTADGRPLPHFAAPGNTVVSAMSAPYAAAGGQGTVAHSDGGAQWYAQEGTSMSSPMAAAVMALWLEADPTLSPARLRDIAVATARRNFDDIGNPRWGAGALDAHAGMMQVLKGGTPTVNIDAQHGDNILYNLQGVAVDPAAATHGLYIRNGRLIRL